MPRSAPPSLADSANSDRISSYVCPGVGELQGPYLQSLVLAECRHQIPHELPLPVSNEQDAPGRDATRRDRAPLLCRPPAHRGEIEAVQLGRPPTLQRAPRIGQKGGTAVVGYGVAAFGSDALLTTMNDPLDQSAGVAIGLFRIQLHQRKRRIGGGSRVDIVVHQMENPRQQSAEAARFADPDSFQTETRRLDGPGPDRRADGEPSEARADSPARLRQSARTGPRFIERFRQPPAHRRCPGAPRRAGTIRRATTARRGCRYR